MDSSSTRKWLYVLRWLGNTFKDPTLSTPLHMGLVIVYVHFILTGFGVPIINIDNYMQIVQAPEMQTNFFRALYYLHLNPPGLSIYIKLCALLGGGNPYPVLEALQPLLHGTACFWFYRGTRLLFPGLPLWTIVILFLNPLVFVYFRYPIYSCLLFTLSCYIVYLLAAKGWQTNRGLFTLCGLVALAGFMRSSWHIGFVALVVGMLIYSSKAPYRYLAALFILLPLSVYFKNLYIYNGFFASSILSQSLARTQLPWLAADSASIAFVPPLALPSQYMGRYNQADPRIARYSDIPELNRDNWQNIRYVVLSEELGQAIRPLYNPIWSFNSFLTGFFVFMQSPSNFFLLKEKSGGITLDNKPPYTYDWLAPMGTRIEGVYFFIDMPKLWHAQTSDQIPGFISTYTIVYLLVLLATPFALRRLGLAFKLSYLICLFFTLVYIIVDYPESNRMRFEIEPFFYLLTIYWADRIYNWFKGRGKPVDLIAPVNEFGVGAGGTP
jgi:hypothetical protein